MVFRLDKIADLGRWAWFVGVSVSSIYGFWDLHFSPIVDVGGIKLGGIMSSGVDNEHNGRELFRLISRFRSTERSLF